MERGASHRAWRFFGGRTSRKILIHAAARSRARRTRRWRTSRVLSARMDEGSRGAASASRRARRGGHVRTLVAFSNGVEDEQSSRRDRATTGEDIAATNRGPISSDAPDRDRSRPIEFRRARRPRARRGGSRPARRPSGMKSSGRTPSRENILPIHGVNRDFSQWRLPMPVFFPGRRFFARALTQEITVGVSDSGPDSPVALRALRSSSGRATSGTVLLVTTRSTGFLARGTLSSISPSPGTCRSTPPP